MAFEGTLKDHLENQSVFEAAYRMACEGVMFSGEAIDATAPYLFRVLTDYIAGYTLLDEAYSCYEAVYGANTLLASRDEMNARLAGIDRNGNRVGKSVPDLYLEYFNRDRYIFVGKNTTSIPLNQTMVLVQNIAKECPMKGDTMKTPDFIQNNPLSDKNVQMIADYCKEKHKSIFQFLLNEMHFDLRVVYNNKTYSADVIRRDINLNMKLAALPNRFGKGWVYNYGFADGREKGELPQKIYLATGRQYITQKEEYHSYGMGVSTTYYWYYAQGVNVINFCTGADEKVQIMKRTRDCKVLEGKDKATDVDYYCSFMFFQAR